MADSHCDKPYCDKPLGHGGEHFRRSSIRIEPLSPLVLGPKDQRIKDLENRIGRIEQALRRAGVMDSYGSD